MNWDTIQQNEHPRFGFTNKVGQIPLNTFLPYTLPSICFVEFSTGKQRMEFHRLEDLAAKPRSFLIGSHEPGSMCTKSSHMLLYVDVYGNQIRWCTMGPPVPLTCTKVTKVNLSIIEDMCIAQHKGKTLIVVADSFEGIFAFNAENNREEWSFPANQLTTSTETEDEEEDEEEEKMFARSITSDQQGVSVCLRY